MKRMSHMRAAALRGRASASSSGIFPGADGVATMIIVRAARPDRRSVRAASGAADSGGTHPLGDVFVIPSTYLNAPAPEARSQLMSLFSPGAPAPATAADHSGPAARGCPALRVTAGHHDADPFPGRHNPWQRQRHCAGGAYLTVARRRETGRRNPQRLRVTLRRPGLQGKNPGKKERS